MLLTHYMPWFRMEPNENGSITWEHWQWLGDGPKHMPDNFREDGRRDIASVYYPLIGPYDGRDPHVLEYHVLTAKAAGIEGFVADWYGPGSFTDDVFARLMTMAEQHGMKAAICLEEKSWFPNYSKATSRAEAQDVAEAQIRHVLEQYGDSPAYLHHHGDPVMYIFENAWQDGVLGNHALTPAELKEVLDRFEQHVLIVRNHYDQKYLGVVRGNYAWVGDQAYKEWYSGMVRDDWLNGKFEYYAYSANPGFNDAGVYGWGQGPRFTDRRGTAEYEDFWNAALAARPNAVQVVTWNDFEEGTTIEPAEEYGFTFVDLTETYAGRLYGRPVNLADNPWGLRIFKLRKAVDALADPEEQAQWNEKIDAFVEDFSSGDSRATESRLLNLEEGLALDTGGR